MASETDNSNTTNQETSQTPDSWHIVQQSSGHCEIVSHSEFTQTDSSPQTWGPFASRDEAIAKRIGLIRAGKCLPN